MSLPWFRLYAEFAHDPKVQMLSEVDQRRYIMILCLRCCNDDVTLHERDEMLRGNGALLHGNEALLSGNNSTLQDDEVAFQLRISMDEWMQTKDRLLGKKLITETNLPTAWERRQKASDSSAARVSAYRERQKNALKIGNVTSSVTETKCNALEGEGEGDREGDKEKDQERGNAREHATTSPQPQMATTQPNATLRFAPPPIAGDKTSIAQNHRVNGQHTTLNFPKFWAAYPDAWRDEEEDARRIWKKNGLDAVADIICADLIQRQTEDYRWQPGERVILPRFYLEDRKWLNKIVKEKPKGKKNGQTLLLGSEIPF